jgi:hypothetical protein
MQSKKPVTTLIAVPKAKTPKRNKVGAKYQGIMSGGRKLTETSMSRMALSMSKYLNSILDPVNEPGAKVPDEITAPSFTTQLIVKFVQNCIAGTGPNTGTIGTGVACTVGSVGPTYGNMVLLAPNAVLGQYVSSAQTGTWSGGGQLVSACSMLRPVSAAIYVQALGSYNNDQGRMLIAYLPPGDPNGNVLTPATPFTATSLANATYVVDIPLIKVAGRCIWLPLDDIARSYIPPGGTGFTNARGNSNTSQYGSLVALVDGAVAATSIEFQLVFNYECIPQSNQLGIVQATVSHSDPLELAAASNFIAGNPTIAQHQPSSLQLTGVPQSGSIKTTSGEHPSFAEMLLSGARAVGGAVKKYGPIVGEIAGMLL